MKRLSTTLSEIFGILSLSSALTFDPRLVRIEDSQIVTSLGDITPVLFHQKSALTDQLIDLSLLQTFVKALDAMHAIVRLNHVGFGYKVPSQDEERQRLVRRVHETDLHLYEEPSNDFGLWLFAGNTVKWEQPLVEFVPVAESQPDTDPFLPHVQIDIDTKLSADEIEQILLKVCEDKITSYRVAVIDGITYIVRNRLGVIDGVNIFLDLATNARNVQYHRRHILKQIS
jgi:hypothetical protein